MSQLFGEVAGEYDEARPGYPAEIVDGARAYHDGVAVDGFGGTVVLDLRTALVVARRPT
ncbi:hypothetical protein [Micromonospora sp. NPDC003776]